MPSSSKSVCTGARDEPVDESAVHVVAQFAAFERTCSQLKDWKPVGKKGPILDVAGVKVVTELLLQGTLASSTCVAPRITLSLRPRKRLNLVGRVGVEP